MKLETTSQDRVMLQLGAGTRPLPGFCNYDIQPSHKDVSMAPADQLPHKDNSVDLIFGNAFFEHLSLVDRASSLKEWKRVLKADGAIVQMGIPCFDSIIDYYLDKKIDLYRAEQWLIGDVSLESFEQCHKGLFNASKLRQLFKEAGFKSVTTYKYCYPGEDFCLNLMVIVGNVDLEQIPNIKQYVNLETVLEIS